MFITRMLNVAIALEFEAQEKKGKYLTSPPICLHSWSGEMYFWIVPFFTNKTFRCCSALSKVFITFHMAGKIWIEIDFFL